MAAHNVEAKTLPGMEAEYCQNSRQDDIEHEKLRQKIRIYRKKNPKTSPKRPVSVWGGKPSAAYNIETDKNDAGGKPSIETANQPPSTAITSFPQCDSQGYNRPTNGSQGFNFTSRIDEDHYDSLMDQSQFFSNRESVNPVASPIPPEFFGLREQTRYGNRRTIETPNATMEKFSGIPQIRGKTVARNRGNLTQLNKYNCMRRNSLGVECNTLNPKAPRKSVKIANKFLQTTVKSPVQISIDYKQVGMMESRANSQACPARERLGRKVQLKELLP